ncbi:MAG: Hsp20/alpha crystallin family protein, partial [Terriglobales bacterium]
MAQRGLVRREPVLQDLWDFRRNFDDIFGHWFDVPAFFSNRGQAVGWLPPVETYVDQNRYHIRLAVPGVEQKDIRVQVHGHELTVSGERRRDEQVSEERLLQREFSYGSFERIIPLPEGIEADKVQAQMNNGVLEITAPLAE